MTLLLNVTRRRIVPPPFGIGEGGYKDAPSHVLVCDACGQEQVFEAIRGVPFEPPFFWLDVGGDRHRGPCCQTKRAIERRRKALLSTTIQELRDMGLTGKQIRSAGLLK